MERNAAGCMGGPKTQNVWAHKRWKGSLGWLIGWNEQKPTLCSYSVTKLCPTLCDPMDQGSLSFTISQSLLKLMCIELVMPSNHLIFCPRGSKSLLQHHAAAAAKSLQLCPTLCDPIDSSPPGSPVPGILQVRTLEWVAISFSNAWKWKVKVKSLSRVQLLATPWTAAYQAPPSMGFSRQEYWSGMPLPSPSPAS